jgi:hypothetical protein
VANDEQEDQEPQQLIEPPFFKITFDGNSYKLDTNMGEHWQWHVLKLAAAIKKEL